MRVFLDHAKDVAFLHDQPVFAVDQHFGAGPFAKQHAIADLDIERPNGAGLVTRTGADREHLTLDRLFLGSIGNNDAAWGLLFGFDALDQNSVVQGLKCAMLRLLRRDVVSKNNCAGRGRLTLTSVNICETPGAGAATSPYAPF
jgi:hypothetical protein